MSFSSSSNVLIGLPPVFRRFLLIIIDFLLLPLAVWLSFWLRLAHPFHPSFMSAGSWLLLAVPLVGLPLYIFTGQYKNLTRYVGSAALYSLAGRNGFLVLLLAGIGVMLRLPMPPRSNWILLWLLLTVFTGAVRFAMRDLLLNLSSNRHEQKLRVAIYGAGEAGAQLAAALRLADNHKIVTFLDDNPAFWSRSINGVGIQPPQVLQDLENSVDQVLLAIPSLPRSERRRIVDDLQSLGITVLQVPQWMTCIWTCRYATTYRIEDRGRSGAAMIFGSDILNAMVFTGAGGSTSSSSTANYGLSPRLIVKQQPRWRSSRTPF